MAGALGAESHLTYKGNLKSTRYGWLRLTPAYSVHLVADLLSADDVAHDVVLDPFCGTGTTALVCAENGIPCDTTDINPFLVWLSKAKSARYSADDIAQFNDAARDIATFITAQEAPHWTPAIHQIEKWWSDATLAALSRMMWRIRQPAVGASQPACNLLKIAFCRVMMEQAHVSFGHQSMSFKQTAMTPMYDLLLHDEDWLAQGWARAVEEISASAASAIVNEPEIIYGDARRLSATLQTERYSHVVTSPPYPNRMSYIRELRPYMYWLGYLSDAREAGEMDWQAIGGTWGIATSKVSRWEPETPVSIPWSAFPQILDQISEHSPLLARYVHKYFHDMVIHAKELFTVVRSGGSIQYIVGNSKFYDVLLPVERIFAAIFDSVGFEQIQVRTLRKRTSKRELYEYIVSAKKPLTR